jgi:hypothetical protein
MAPVCGGLFHAHSNRRIGRASAMHIAHELRVIAALMENKAPVLRREQDAALA